MDEPRVETRSRGYNLRSGRRIQYESPLVSRVPRSPAHVHKRWFKLHNIWGYYDEGLQAEMLASNWLNIYQTESNTSDKTIVMIAQLKRQY